MGIGADNEPVNVAEKEGEQGSEGRHVSAEERDSCLPALVGQSVVAIRQIETCPFATNCQAWHKRDKQRQADDKDKHEPRIELA